MIGKRESDGSKVMDEHTKAYVKGDWVTRFGDLGAAHVAAKVAFGCLMIRINPDRATQGGSPLRSVEI